jgi:hypothetical protein
MIHIFYACHVTFIIVRSPRLEIDEPQLKLFITPVDVENQARGSFNSTMSTIDGPIADPDFLRFPPFPVPPSGTKIIPFKDFKERGIQMNLSGDSNRVEVDGLGIPTVEMRSKHGTDQCKTGSAVRLKKKPPPPDRGRLEGKKKWEWWDIWEEGEDLRGVSFSHYSYVFFN